MPDATDLTCKLDPEDRPRREADVHALRARLVARYRAHDREAILVFAAGSDELVRRFVRDESSCCSFFAFDVERDGESVRLRVTTPEGGEAMLGQLIDALDG